MDLAQLDGWDIVVAPDAIESEVYAAGEFQRFYQEASGIELPIVRETDRPDRHFFIGPGHAMRASDAGFDTADMGDEALRIVVSPANIAIAGGRPRGTLYGVYTFLEDHLGVRFLTPGHTHVPPVGDTRPLPPSDRSYDPPVVFRWSFWHSTNNELEFAARIRCNAVTKDRPDLGGPSRYDLINHSLHRYIATKDYAAEHPEYFAFVDGARRVDVNNGDSHYYGTQLCMTNPDVTRILTEKVLAQLRANAGIRLIQLGQGDNTYYCRCETCAAVDEREDTHMGALLTGVNRVAEAIADEFPEVRIGTLAYSYSIKPPKTLRAHDNVIIQICNIGASVTKPLEDLSSSRNADFARDLAGWREQASHLAIWTYATNFHEFLLPTPSLHVWDKNIRHYLDSGITQMFVQGNRQSPGGAFGDVTNYVISRLLWDPSLDGRQLTDEFLDLHYGPAAPPIRRYLDRVFETYKTKDIDQYCNGNAEEFGIDALTVRAGLDAVSEAKQLADSEAVKDRLEVVEIWMRRAAVESAWNLVDPRKKPSRNQGESVESWLKRQGHETGFLDKETQARTRPHLRRLFQLIRKHGVTHWRENMAATHAEQLLREASGLVRKEEPW